MVSFMSRLESMMERWQSRKKSIAISQLQNQCKDERGGGLLARKLENKFAFQAENNRLHSCAPIDTSKEFTIPASNSTGANGEQIPIENQTTKMSKPKSHNKSASVASAQLANDGNARDPRRLKLSGSLDRQPNGQIVLTVDGNNNNATVNESHANSISSNLDSRCSDAVDPDQETKDGILAQINCTPSKLSSSCSVVSMNHATGTFSLLYLSACLMLALTTILPTTHLVHGANHQSIWRHHEASSHSGASLAGIDRINTREYVAKGSAAGNQVNALHISPVAVIDSATSLVRRLFAPSQRRPGPDSARDPPYRRYQSTINGAFNRIGQRIGARDSIRVHNAFRDLAWRLLSSFSMPTPVIYELRRQNFYSPEDDIMNDSFWNRNTTKTIRSKRHSVITSHILKHPFNKAPSGSVVQFRQGKKSAAGRQDEDEDLESRLRDRMRMRLEDLLSLSRRSLFGRVIRVPSFLFRRQQDGADKSQDANGSTKSDDLGFIARMRRRKKDSERQMISINGKQYYVNDEGELKDWNERD